MGAVILDTSVVTALADPNDVHHAAAVAIVRAHRRRGAVLILPTSVLSEVLVGVHRRDPKAVPLRRHQLRDTFGRPRAIDEEVAVAAAELRGRYTSLRLPDAFVVAVAVVDRAEEVLTADKALAKVDERVRVIG
jgi:predicted nucleic acid-binding protein